MKKKQISGAVAPLHFTPIDLSVEILTRKQQANTAYIEYMVKAGVTLINDHKLGVYLGLCVTESRKAFDMMQMYDARAMLFCSKRLSSEMVDFIDVIVKGQPPRMFTMVPDYEEHFWRNPTYLLDHVQDAKFIIVELNDVSGFEVMLSELKQLDDEAKEQGVAVLLSCKWDLEVEYPFPFIRLDEGKLQFGLSKQIELDCVFHDWEGKYVLPQYYAIVREKTKWIRFYHDLGFTHNQIVAKAGVSLATVVKALKPEERSADASAAAVKMYATEAEVTPVTQPPVPEAAQETPSETPLGNTINKNNQYTSTNG